MSKSCDIDYILYLLLFNVYFPSHSGSPKRAHSFFYFLCVPFSYGSTDTFTICYFLIELCMNNLIWWLPGGMTLFTFNSEISLYNNRIINLIFTLLFHAYKTVVFSIVWSMNLHISMQLVAIIIRVQVVVMWPRYILIWLQSANVLRQFQFDGFLRVIWPFFLRFTQLIKRYSWHIVASCIKNFHNIT
jgi:hypothetical protein